MPTTAGFNPLALRNRALRILLVEDSAGDALLMEEVFGLLTERVELTVCTDASQLFKSLRTPGRPVPDMVMLNLHLSGRSGFDVLAELKGDPQLRRIPVMILSGSDDPGNVARAYDEHASAYLVKPIDFDELQAQMAAMVRFWSCCGVIG